MRRVLLQLFLRIEVMSKSRHTRNIAIGVSVGTVAGLIIAAMATFLDWRTNPSGIFHDSSGTDWLIVAETGLSWFVPVFVIATAVTFLILLWTKR